MLGQQPNSHGRMTQQVACGGKRFHHGASWLALILLTSLPAAMIAGWSPLACAMAEETKASAPRTPQLVEATKEQISELGITQVHEVTLDDSLVTTGRVGFNEDRLSPVFSPYGGRVLEVRANKGELVKAGQDLLIVETPDLLSAVNDLSAAHADEDKAQIAVDIAEKSAQRARTLNAQEALATKELQAAESDFERAKDDLRRAHAAVTVARNRLSLFGKSAEEIAAMEKSVSNEMDSRVRIKAPFAGTIVDRKVGPGQYIKPDLPDPLFLIGDLTSLWVNADVYESSLSLVRVGAPVEVTVAAYPERRFSGKIASVSPTVDPSTRTLHVRCAVENPGGLLKPEMFATVRLSGGAARKALTIPTPAVITLGSANYALVEASSGKFERREIKIGRELQGRTVVESGLRATDRVVTRSVMLLNSSFQGK